MPSSPTRRATHARLTGPLVGLTTIALLTSCAGTPADRLPGEEGAAPTASGASEGFPLTVDNCGFQLTVPEEPRRVVTVKSSTLELMLALGLGDRVVGAAFLDGPIPEQYDDAGTIDVISDTAPGQEAVLALEPDLVFAGWESNFAADSAGERSALDALGVATYVAPSACKGEDYMPDPLTFEIVFDEISQAGEIFGVPEAAEQLVAEQRETLEQVTPDPRGATALWYSSGSDVPYVGAGIGAPQMIMDAVGLANVAADVHDTWTPFGWEEVVAADPDVIVLVDSAWNTADRKKDLLSTNPATKKLTAVRQERYLVVPFPATEAGVRNVSAVVDLVDQLADLDLGATS